MKSSLCFPGSAIQDIPDMQMKTHFTSNPRPNPNKDLHTYDPYVMFPHNVISAILVPQSNETTNTEQTSPMEKAPFSYVKPFFF